MKLSPRCLLAPSQWRSSGLTRSSKRRRRQRQSRRQQMLPKPPAQLPHCTRRTAHPAQRVDRPRKVRRQLTAVRTRGLHMETCSCIPVPSVMSILTALRYSSAHIAQGETEERSHDRDDEQGRWHCCGVDAGSQGRGIPECCLVGTHEPLGKDGAVLLVILSAHVRLYMCNCVPACTCATACLSLCLRTCRPVPVIAPLHQLTFAYVRAI